MSTTPTSDACLVGMLVLVIATDPAPTAKPSVVIRKCLCGSYRYGFTRNPSTGDCTLECHGCGIHSRPEGAKTEAEAVRRWNRTDTVLNYLHAFTKTT